MNLCSPWWIPVFSQVFSTAVVLSWFGCSEHGILVRDLQQCPRGVRMPVGWSQRQGQGFESALHLEECALHLEECAALLISHALHLWVSSCYLESSAWVSSRHPLPHSAARQGCSEAWPCPSTAGLQRLASKGGEVRQGRVSVLGCCSECCLTLGAFVDTEPVKPDILLNSHP